MFVTGLVCLKPLHGVELCLLSRMQVAPSAHAHTSATKRRENTANQRKIGTEKTGTGRSALAAGHSPRPPGRSPQSGRKA